MTTSPICVKLMTTLLFVYVLKGMVLGGSAAVTPGPFQIYLLSQAIKNGWQRTLPAALAPLISDGPIIALVFLVLSSLPDWFMQTLRFVSGLFILYLSYGAYQSYKQSGMLSPEELVDAPQHTLSKAIVLNFVSPGPYIFWGFISGPILVQAWAESVALGVSFVASFYISFVGVMSVLILLFALARKAGPKVMRTLLGVAALALFGVGLYQVLSVVLGM